MSESTGLLSLPRDILITIPNFLHTLEDYANLASTCRLLHSCMDAASPRTILRLAAAQSRIFFRPSPHFLVAAVASQLGDWARQSPSNESQFVQSTHEGIDGLLSLALLHCGLTMARIRQLHLYRFSTINPVTNIIDQCVGTQWYSLPDFWNGGADDAYTIQADPPQTLFHLAIYGELFGPDLETFLNRDTVTRTLSVETRLEFVKYCIPDFATTCDRDADDPRRAIEPVGPYKPTEKRPGGDVLNDNNIALTWVLKSSRWKPHWQKIRNQAGPDFRDDFEQHWHYDEDDSEEEDRSWRAQRMWESVMCCQGLAGLRMIAPDLDGGEKEEWLHRIRDWREKIDRLPHDDEVVRVLQQATHNWPFLQGDLRICASGFVTGT